MEAAIQTAIDRARRTLSGLGIQSSTTPTFQDDLLEFIAANQTEGESLIEVGCFLGGLTAQLAVIASVLDKHLYVVDYYEPNLLRASAAVRAVAPEAHVSFHHGTFDQFVKNVGNPPKPLVAFIDGAHTYEGVMADVLSLYRLSPLPYAAAFHDFVLRGTDTGEPNSYVANVDGALYDAFGRDFVHQPMGEISGIGPTLHTEFNPGEGGYHHLNGFPEAVLVVCSEVNLRRTPS